MKKQDYADTLSTLMSLDRIMTADLMNLSEDTLAKMCINYTDQAKRANFALEEAVKNADKYRKFLDT